jgi:UTP--glucose-1-phosphate uridylyltransferase
MFDLDSLDKKIRTVLDQNGFDSVSFSELVRRLARDGVDPEQNRIESEIALAPESALFQLPIADTGEAERIKSIGCEAIENGHVGVIVLNGGMATRFGGTAKGATTAFASRSFLDLKLSQVGQASHGKAPIFLMNSLATDQITRDHLAGLDLDCEIRLFNQMVSMRLRPDGEVFLDELGQPSLHAPGHGDLPFAFRQSGELSRFVEGGGRYLTVSNVDNLGAGLDPLIVGAHIDQGKPMSVEVVETFDGDVGGFPALVDGRVSIVEAFRIPKSFDVKSIPVFNTNTFIFDVQAFDSEFVLDWFIVQKEVGGKPVVQFERLVGQLTEFVDTTWLKVPRTGQNSRFVPIKVPSDLVEQAEVLEQVLRLQGVL